MMQTFTLLTRLLTNLDESVDQQEVQEGATPTEVTQITKVPSEDERKREMSYQ